VSYCDKYLEQIGELAFRNKYAKTYLSLCQNAAARAASKSQAAFQLGMPIESHHILPRCFNLGGRIDKTNLVHLTLREHFIAHLLLTKMFAGRFKMQMLAALVWMCTTGRFSEHSNSWIYDQLRSEFYLRGGSGGSKGHNKGSVHTKEWKQDQAKRAIQQWSDSTALEAMKKTCTKLAISREAKERSRKAAQAQMADPVQRALVAERMRGRFPVYNSTLGKEKRIREEDWPSFESQGYIKGKLRHR
jgi:hypothetical protein